MTVTSLSTMWGIGRFDPFIEFFPAACRLGFRYFELNHQVNSAMLEGLDPQLYTIVSVHEPCPADISTGTLKDRNWLVSAPDEDCRRQGVHSVERSIDLAREVGASAVVVHLGRVDVDVALEERLSALFNAGLAGSAAYAEAKARLAAARAAQAGANLEAARRSLAELAEYAARAGVRLGLENRYHCLDIPLPDEMEMFLQDVDPEWVGFWYDVGHAQTLDRLGFARHEEWFERFTGRLIGVHLHDVRGIHDHLAAGLGEVDWGMVAAHLPPDPIRTCEFHSSNSPAQAAAGLRFLAEQGCLGEAAEERLPRQQPAADLGT